MAAPTIAASKKSATLTKLAGREKEKKPIKTKNLLCPKLEEWPRPSLEVQEAILSKLTACLSGVPSIFRPKKKDQGTDLAAKAKIRSQLDIGVSSVFRSLEKNSLSCILVSGKATPAISVNHVITLAREMACPLLCLEDLAPTVAKATDSKCMPLAIGFKRTSDTVASDFADVISLTVANSSVKAESESGSSVPQGTQQSEKQVPGENCLWPVSFDRDSEKELLSELVRTVAEAPKDMTASVVEIKSKKKKKKKEKKNLKSCFNKSFSHQFEIGRRAVTEILERGKLQLILVSGEVKTVLAAESSSSASSSLLRLAAKKECPVFCLNDMMEALKPHFGGCVTFLGLKKFSHLEDSSTQHFQSLVSRIKEELENSKFSTTAPGSNHASVSEMLLHTTKAPLEGSGTSKQSGGVTEEVEDGEDFSYLYVMKKDSKELAEKLRKEKLEAEQAQKNLTFCTDFISLSGASEKNVKVKATRAQGSKSSTPKMRPKTAASDNNSSVQKEVKSHPMSGQSLVPKENRDVPQNVSPSPNSIASKQKEEENFLALSSTPDKAAEASEGGVVSKQKDENFLAFSASDVDSAKVSELGENKMDVPEKDSDVKNDSSGHKMETDDLPLFSLDRTGQAELKEPSGTQAGPKGHDPGDGRGEAQPLLTQTRPSQILGLGDLKTPSSTKTESFLSFSSSSSSSKKAKKALKRKLEGDSSFISFAYNETNIKTMVANLDKKRKKKKKKK